MCNENDRTDLQVESRTTSVFRSGIARGLAAFLGGFSLLNVVGELRDPGFDANLWWIDFRPFPTVMSRTFLAAAAVLLLAYAVRASLSRWRRLVTIAAVLLLTAVTLRNTITFYVLLGGREIHAGVPVPFSLFVCISLLVILQGLRKARASPPRFRLRPSSDAGHVRLGFGPAAPTRLPRTPAKTAAVMVLTLFACLIAFPLAQMVCFGKTYYRRPADAIVVFGAKAYADGRPSDALSDRVRTGCQLYRDGLARTLIFSGGPGDGAVHETEAMRRMAIELGVPDEAILLDPDGVNTQATIRNTIPMFERLGAGRVLAVSHFYHLPRIKMSYQREGREVFTVAARETYVLTAMPFYLAREIAALWVYYIRPLIP